MALLRLWIKTAAVIVFLIAVPPSASAQPGQKLLESRESLYNNIYVYKQGPYVSMTFGYNKTIYTESVYNTRDDLDLPVSYTRFMTVTLNYAKHVRSILEIGFGGGRTAWYLHRSLPNVPITAVELDPTVLELAQKYFGIREERNFHLVNSDGRLFLTKATDHYDIILIDAYRGPFVPFHLLTKEFYQTVSDHVADGGVVAQNVDPSTMLFDASVKTMRSVFSQLEFYRSDGNIVTLAYKGASRSTRDLTQVALHRQKMYNLRYPLGQMITDRVLDTVIDGRAMVLTDDFAPVDSLKAIRNHNRKWPPK